MNWASEGSLLLLPLLPFSLPFLHKLPVASDDGIGDLCEDLGIGGSVFRSDGRYEVKVVGIHVEFATEAFARWIRIFVACAFRALVTLACWCKYWCGQLRSRGVIGVKVLKGI